jgi:lipopolysaccharide transport system ATP-binding protein
MTEPAIRLEGVSKRYYLGTGYGSASVSQRVERGIARPLRFVLGTPKPSQDIEEFWALRELSLEVEQGEVLGVIGRNGAGKSTLLKLLSRISPPTEGRITLNGRVGVLLEVGTGFHPELTGRENVFLNGAILGLRGREIAARFEEIVEFSGIEKFIDTPVKRYSSGMFVRLAFSVAAHLEPEILLVDEVLSVGDAEFQRKSMAKMEDLSESEGHTIVFVSHGMSTVRQVANRIVLLENGRKVMDGPSDEVVVDYMERVKPVQHGGISKIDVDVPRVGIGGAKLCRMALLDRAGNVIDQVRFGQPFTVALTLEVEDSIRRAIVEVGISTPEGERVVTAYSTDGGGPELRLQPGTVEVRAELNVTLFPGEFVLDAALHSAQGPTIDDVERVLSFTALSLAPEGSGDHYPWEYSRGTVRPDSEWTLSERGEFAPPRAVQ